MIFEKAVATSSKISPDSEENEPKTQVLGENCATKPSQNQLAIMWDFLFGPKWETWLTDNRYHVSVAAGWELLQASGAILGLLFKD